VDIPIIGSLNGVSTGGWTEYAERIEQAGADALELNVYYIPTDGKMNSEEVERRYTNLVRTVVNSVKIPVAIKLAPYFSSIPHMICSLDKIGVRGMVLFNRFYQPDVDIDNLKVDLHLSLSTSQELLLRLRWVAILYGQIQADMALTGGVHTTEDVVKTMMAGARVAMMTSALLKNGIPYLGSVLSSLSFWMEKHQYSSILEMQGLMSQGSVAEPAAFERANYMKVLHSYWRAREDNN